MVGMTLGRLLRRRRNVYGFSTRPLPADVLKRVLENATHVPSAGFTQDFDFVVVKADATKRKLAEAANQGEYERAGLASGDFISRAPVVVVPCGSKARYEARYGRPGEANSRLPWWVVDASFAAFALILSAFEEGLGASFVGALDDQKVAAILNLPKDGSVVPLAVVPIGYPDPAEIGLWKQRRARSIRRPLSEVVHYESW